MMDNLKETSHMHMHRLALPWILKFVPSLLIVS